MPTNESIKSILGTTQGTATSQNAATSPVLKQISTNGALMVQNLGELTKAIATLTKAWGG